jgi:predicted anti-sigma-YlaC factor YlaD
MTTDLDCKEVSRMISEGLDRTLSPQEGERLRWHFVICQTCRNVDLQMAFLRRAMQRLGQGENAQK